MLEDELEAGHAKLVGPNGLAHRSVGVVGLQTSQAERTQLYLANDDVRECAAGTAEHQDAAGVAGNDLARASTPPKG